MPTSVKMPWSGWWCWKVDVSNYYFGFWLEFWLPTGDIIMEMKYLTAVLDEILAGVACNGPTEGVGIFIVMDLG